MNRGSKISRRMIVVSLVSCVFLFSIVDPATSLETIDREPGFQSGISGTSGELSLLASCAVFSQPWDWEGVGTVTFRDYTGENSTIFLPWYQGAPTDIPLEIRLDYKAEDGWVLLHNFVDGGLKDCNGNAVTIDYPVKFFALYNKYRGILRFFYVHNQNSSYTDFLYGFAVTGRTSLLNFARDLAKPDEEKFLDPFLERANIKKFGNASGPRELHWHFFDVELAYDPSIAGKSYSTVEMRWLGNGIDVTSITINGKIEGTIVGNIDIAGSNISNVLNIGGLSFNAGRADHYNTSVTINHAADAAAKVQAKAERQKDTFLKARLEKLAGDLLNKAVNYITSPLSQIFGSLIGGSKKSSPPVDNVNLRLEADINLNGTMTLTKPIFDQTLKVPGTQYVANQDLVVVPLYDKPLGVLTIAKIPEVVWEEWFEYDYSRSEFVYLQNYYIKSDSVQVELNPSVTDALRIKMVREAVYFYVTYKGDTKLEGIFRAFPVYVFGTLVDSDPDNTVYDGGASITTLYRNVLPIPYDLWDSGYMTYGRDDRVVVRVTVELERVDPQGNPIPGADPILWSKTYRPKYTQDKSKSPVRYIDPGIEILPR